MIPAAARHRLFDARVILDGAGERRQEHVEAGARAWCAGHVDDAVMLGNDAVHDREAEAGAIARVLVVKNGSKMRSSVASSMPQPSSLTTSST